VNRHWPWAAAAALCATLAAAAIAAAGEPGFSSSVTPGLMNHFARLFGAGSRTRLEGWKEFARASASRMPASADRAEQLRTVNGFFNKLPGVEDQVLWGVEDHWATPAEFLASGGGDCEDYAIGKYFTLKELGVPVSRLRLVYAKTWRASTAHMVLAYYSVPGGDPLILDNLEGAIERAADRPDLIPVYLFNDDELQYVVNGADGARYNALSIRKWRELLAKLALELTY